jgi:hypothetical protein
MSSREGGPIGTLCVSLSYANQLCAKWAEGLDREIILKPACHSLPSSRPKLDKPVYGLARRAFDSVERSKIVNLRFVVGTPIAGRPPAQIRAGPI